MLDEIIRLLTELYYYKNETYYGSFKVIKGYEFKNKNDLVVLFIKNSSILFTTNDKTIYYTFNDFHDYLIVEKRKKKIKTIKDKINYYA